MIRLIALRTGNSNTVLSQPYAEAWTFPHTLNKNAKFHTVHYSIWAPWPGTVPLQTDSHHLRFTVGAHAGFD